LILDRITRDVRPCDRSPRCSPFWVHRLPFCDHATLGPPLKPDSDGPPSSAASSAGWKCEDEDVIPTAIVAGLVVGRWAVPVIAVAWAIWLLIDGSCSGTCSPTAALLAAANAVVGVAVHRGIRFLVERKA